LRTASRQWPAGLVITAHGPKQKVIKGMTQKKQYQLSEIPPDFPSVLGTKTTALAGKSNVSGKKLH